MRDLDIFLLPRSKYSVVKMTSYSLRPFDLGPSYLVGQF